MQILIIINKTKHAFQAKKLVYNSQDYAINISGRTMRFNYAGSNKFTFFKFKEKKV